MDIAVLYLAWIPYGPQYFNDFLENYLEMPSGHEHTLVILLNGISLVNTGEVDRFKSILYSKKITNYKVLQFDSGQDIEIYQEASKIIEADYFLFLNTYSKFLATNWLQHYINNLQGKVGLIGATSSYASYLSAIADQTLFDLRSKKSLTKKINSLKYYLKIYILHGRKFKKFPAPHVRTNAFFISSSVFNRIKKVKIKNKMEAYYFENGRSSMTEQVLAMGLRCIVIDRYGKAFGISQWAESNTFWINAQDNLLVSDNQTNKYNASSGLEKKLLNKIAWNL